MGNISSNVLNTSERKLNLANNVIGGSIPREPLPFQP
jgi:hypothetical protein